MLNRDNNRLISESPLIRSFLKLLSHHSWLVLDLDNTVMEPLGELGSDQWFVKLIEYACQIIPDKQEAIAAVIAVYHEVQHHLRMKAVESNIVNIVNTLQDIGIPVIGLTARDAVLKKATLRQLDEIGIDFNGKIIFCNGKDKGDCLKEFLKRYPDLPAHIVMVDDKEKHLIHVKKAVESLGIRFNGIRYSFLDEKVKNIDMKNAHIQLAHLKSRLSTSTQRIIEQLQILPQDIALENSNYTDLFVMNDSTPFVNNKKQESLIKKDNGIIKAEELTHELKSFKP